MQAYASTELHPNGNPLPRSIAGEVATRPVADRSLIEHLLGQIADLVVDRLAERTKVEAGDRAVRWLDVRGAADYLGIHPDTLRKLAAQRAIPTHQHGPRCKLFFLRGELDEWRLAAKPVHSRTPRLRAV
jgi:excisionase family DNA binding protein